MVDKDNPIDIYKYWPRWREDIIGAEERLEDAQLQHRRLLQMMHQALDGDLPLATARAVVVALKGICWLLNAHFGIERRAEDVPQSNP
tara:strand:+ start:1384 stop:1647 length:264 start_codon:yes stop_codon:yes gene_type:complete